MARDYNKSDIKRLSKPISDLNIIYVYFLVFEKEVVYVNSTRGVEAKICEDLKDKVFDEYFSYPVDSERIASEKVTSYISKFQPKYNVLGDDKKEAKEVPKKESSRELKIKPKKEREYIAVNPQVVVSMPAKQAIEMPVESVKIKAQKTYRTRPLVRYLQNISLQPGCYKIDKRNGTNYLFVNINNKAYYALADAERYTYEETTYRMPDEMKGYLKDIVVN